MAKKRMGRFTKETKPLKQAGPKYGSGYGATVSRAPAFTHGRVLREERVERGLSQQTVADLLGKNVSQVSRAESSSDFYPRLSMLVAHLNALGMRLAIQRPDGSFQVLPIDDFLWADGSPKSDGAKARKKAGEVKRRKR
jgi:transcriptional regulator with XRE-family HTH domain